MLVIHNDFLSGNRLFQSFQPLLRAEAIVSLSLVDQFLRVSVVDPGLYLVCSAAQRAGRRTVPAHGVHPLGASRQPTYDLPLRHKLVYYRRRVTYTRAPATIAGALFLLRWVRRLKLTD